MRKNKIELKNLMKKNYRDLTPRELVRKSILLQVVDIGVEVKQSEIINLLKLAIKKDDRYVEAYIELGWFYYALVEDNNKAKANFLKAIEILVEFNQHTVKGITSVEEDVDEKCNRRKTLTQYKKLILGTDW